MKEDKKEISEQSALQRLAALCSRGEHSSGEMLEKMRRWGLSEEAQARIMERLLRDRYVDDERFAHAFVNDKVKYNKWGRRKIEQALWQKGVDEEIRRRVLDEVEEENFLTELRDLLKVKSRSITAKNDYERNMKLMRFALGRGYSYDQIRRCITLPDDDMV